MSREVLRHKEFEGCVDLRRIRDWFICTYDVIPTPDCCCVLLLISSEPLLTRCFKSLWNQKVPMPLRTFSRNPSASCGTRLPSFGVKRRPYWPITTLPRVQRGPTWM